MDMETYAEEELERLEKERKEAMEQKGFAPFYKITEGTHDLEFSKDVLPRQNLTYPGRVIFRIVWANGEAGDKDVSISRSGPLYKEILSQLKQGHYRLRIQRIGTGIKDSRYSVKPLQ